MQVRVILSFLLMISIQSYAQQRTYYYIAKEVWENGVKSKPANGETGHYYTFINALCYESDSQGYKLASYTPIYKFQGEKKGNLWYVEDTRNNPLPPCFFLQVTKDFSVINTITAVGGTNPITVVLRKAKAPKASDGIPDMKY